MMPDLTPYDIVSDDEIERVHGFANFGKMTKRSVVDEGVLKSAFGYSSGYTQLGILIEHGLVRKPKPGRYDTSLTKKGQRYLRARYGGRLEDIAALPHLAAPALIDDIRRILDERSAWIARPNAEVDQAIAIAAGCTALRIMGAWDRVVTQYRAAAPAPAVPDGWKLVPVEPTDDMECAPGIDPDDCATPDAAARIYGAMIAAAPAPAVVHHEAPIDDAQAGVGFDDAVKYLQARRDDYIAEHGAYDPETGATEFSRRGEEYVSELEEIIDALKALKAAAAAPEPPVVHHEAPTRAEADVLAERRRQIEDEGYTAEYDDQHALGMLSFAGAAYAIHGASDDAERDRFARTPPVEFPWRLEWWKPTSRRRDLVKAAALIIAEIDRLDRVADKAAKAESHD